jgi:hypothetical protein
MLVYDQERPPMLALRELNENQVLTFADWCRLNAISPSTGRRILKSGQGPTVVKLSQRRLGITLGANAKWQAKRAAQTEHDQTT